jgi:AcrR family transcriptional regulator
VFSASALYSTSVSANRTTTLLHRSGRVLPVGAGSAREGTGVLLDQAGSAREGTGALLDQAGSAREGTGALLDQAGSAREGTGALLDQAGSAREGTGAAEQSEVEALIAATWAVAARAGSIEPSVREILEQAGLSTKAFYRHFRSKDQLLLVALDEGTRVLVDYLERRMAAAADPLAAIGAWIEGFVRQAANPSAAQRTRPWTLGTGRLASRFPADFDRNQRAIAAPLEREITRAVAEGLARSPDPARDARLIYAYTSDTVRVHLLRGTVPDAETTAHLVTFAHRALAAR